MGDHTKIQWTDCTWNPARGCSKVSAGCMNCYAEAVARRFHAPGLAYEGVATDRGWTGKVKLVEKHLGDPLRWKKPRKIFVNSMSDLFHESLTFGEIDEIFAVMALAKHHTFQILTKRPARMLEYAKDFKRRETFEGVGIRIPECVSSKLTKTWMPELEWPLPNVWLGVSVEGQKTADERIPVLLQTSAAVRFISAEPLLGPVELQSYRGWLEPFHETDAMLNRSSRLDWVIVGGESGPGARPCNVEWIGSIVRQCKESETAVFVKQLGSFVVDRNDAGFDGDDGDRWGEHGGIVTEDLNPGVESLQGDPVRIRLIDPKGGEINEFPADLRVREFPATYPILEK